MSMKIKDVTKKYGKYAVLNNVSFDIKDGEFISILGPSGCGKTTLLKLIAGFDVPDSGEIRINDELVSSSKKFIPPQKRNLGMVFQSFALWPHMTVREHIEFPIKYHHFVSDEIRKNIRNEVEHILQITGLERFSERFPDELSGGQRQRVSIARALAAQPAVLLMDEPLSALDAELRIEMRKEIKRIHDITGETILYVTHDQSEALSMSDRIIILKDSKMEQIGTPEDIYLKPETEFVASFVSKANLIKGVWKDNSFEVYTNEGNLCLKDSGICRKFKNNGIYPVRPEEFKICTNEDGFKAIIKGIQYQGKECNYVVEALGQTLNVCMPSIKHFKIGDAIKLNIN